MDTLKTLKIVFPDGKELRLDVISDLQLICNSVEKKQHNSNFESVELEISYTFLCSGFEYQEPKESFFKKFLRKKAIKYFGF